MMKYWDTLTELENEILRVREFKTLVAIVTRGLTETASTSEETSTGLHILFNMIEDIDSKMHDSFYSLWDQVRADSCESDEQYEDENYDELEVELNKNSNNDSSREIYKI